MDLGKYRLLMWQFISLADSGKYEHITVDQVHKHAEAETLHAFLDKSFGNDIDLSLMNKQDWDDLNNLWSNIANVTAYKRKFGVENKGICLLMAYVLETLQNFPEGKQ